VPCLCEFNPGICLTTEEKARKNLSQGTFYLKITVQVHLIFNALFALKVSHRPAELKFIVIKPLPVKTIPLQTSHFTAVSEFPFPYH